MFEKILDVLGAIIFTAFVFAMVIQFMTLRLLKVEFERHWQDMINNITVRNERITYGVCKDIKESILKSMSEYQNNTLNITTNWRCR
jgi:hypothetical protein